MRVLALTLESFVENARTVTAAFEGRGFSHDEFDEHRAVLAALLPPDTREAVAHLYAQVVTTRLALSLGGMSKLDPKIYASQADEAGRVRELLIAASPQRIA